MERNPRFFPRNPRCFWWWLGFPLTKSSWDHLHLPIRDIGRWNRWAFSWSAAPASSADSPSRSRLRTSWGTLHPRPLRSENLTTNQDIIWTDEHSHRGVQHGLMTPFKAVITSGWATRFGPRYRPEFGHMYLYHLDVDCQLQACWIRIGIWQFNEDRVVSGPSY